LQGKKDEEYDSMLVDMEKVSKSVYEKSKGISSLAQEVWTS